MKKIIFLLAIIASFTANAGSVGVLKGAECKEGNEYGKHTNDLASRLSTGDFSPANCSADEYVRFAVQLFSEKLPELGISTIGHVQWMVNNSEPVLVPLDVYDRYTTPGSCKNAVVDETSHTMSWSGHLRKLTAKEREKYVNGVPFLSYQGLLWCNLICWNLTDFYQAPPVEPVPDNNGEGELPPPAEVKVNKYYYITNNNTVIYENPAPVSYWGNPVGANISLWFTWGNYQNSCQSVNYCQPPVQCWSQPVQVCVPYTVCPTNYVWQNLYTPVYGGCTTTPVVHNDHPNNGSNGDSDGDLPGNGPSKIYQSNHPKTGRSFEVPKGVTSVSNDVSQSGTRPSVKPSLVSAPGVRPQPSKGNTYASIIGNTPKGSTVNPGYSESSTSDVRPNNSFVLPIKNPGIRPGKEVSTNSSYTQPSLPNNTVKGSNNSTTSYVPPPRTKNNGNYTSGPRQTVAPEQAIPKSSVNYSAAPRPRNVAPSRPSVPTARGNTGSRPAISSAPMARGGVR